MSFDYTKRKPKNAAYCNRRSIVEAAWAEPAQSVTTNRGGSHHLVENYLQHHFLRQQPRIISRCVTASRQLQQRNMLESQKQEYNELLHCIAHGEYKPNTPIEIAIMGNFLKNVLVFGRGVGLARDDLNRACGVILTRITADKMARADSQHISNLGNLLKTLLETNNDAAAGLQSAVLDAVEVLLNLITPHKMAQANNQALSNLGNLLKTLLGLKDNDAVRLRPAVLRAVAVLLNQMTSEKMMQTDIQHISNLGNLLKTLLGLKDNDAVRLRTAVPRAVAVLLNQMTSERMAQADSQHISNLGNLLKTLLETNNAAAADLQSAVLDAVDVLLNLITPHKMAQANNQALANLGNLLKTLLETNNDNAADLQPAVLDAVDVLLNQMTSDKMAQADIQHISNLGNLLKTLLGLKDNDAVRLRTAVPRAVAVLLNQMTSERMAQAGIQHISNLGNLLKSLLGLKDNDAVRLQSAVLDAVDVLLNLITPHKMAQANNQALSNLGNLLKTLLETNNDNAADLQPAVLDAVDVLLNQMTSDKMAQADIQHISNLGNLLKTLLGLKDNDAVHLRTAVPRAVAVLLNQMTSDKMAQADNQELANLGNLLKSLLGLKDNDADGLQPAVPRAVAVLLKQMTSEKMAQADIQHISNLGNLLKTLLETNNDDAAGLQSAVLDAVDVLLNLITPHKMEQANNQELANLGNLLNTLFDMNNADGLQPAVLRVVDVLLNQMTSERMAQADNQALSNLGNLLNTLFDKNNADCLRPAVPRAVAVLLNQMTSERMAQADNQALANLGNLLKTLLETNNDNAADLQPAVLDAVAVLLNQITSDKMVQADIQHISNLGNLLKTLLETNNDAAAGLQSAVLDAVAVLLNQMTFDKMAQANNQELANLGNLLKTLFETNNDNAAGLQPAVPRAVAVLLNQMTSEKMAQADIQHIANLGNLLKTLFETNNDAAAGLQPAVPRAVDVLLNQMTSERMAQASSQHIANLGNLLKTLLGLKDNGAICLQPTVRHAVEVLLSGITAKKMETANGQDIANVCQFITQAALHDDVGTEVSLISAATVIVTQLLSGAFERVDTLYGVRIVNALRHMMSQGLLIENQWLALASDFYGHYTQPDKARAMTEQGQANVLALATLLLMQGIFTAEQGQGLHQAMPMGASLSPETASLRLASDLCLYRFEKGGVRLAVSQRLIAVVQALQLGNVPGAGIPRRTLRALALQLHKLKLAFNRTRPGGLDITVLDTRLMQAGELLKTAILDSLEDGGEFDATGLEIEFVRKYTGTFLMPHFSPLTHEDEDAIAQDAFSRLAGEPRAITPSRMHLHAMSLWGSPLSNDDAQVAQGAIYHSLFGEGLGTPVLIKPKPGERASDWPAFIKHKRMWYRADLLRGGMNKAAEKRPGQLLGIPLAAASFLSRYWFTSTESRAYGVRAFLPNRYPALEGAPFRPGGEGCFSMAMIPDVNSAQHFSLTGDYGRYLQIKDGCGFIREDAAEKWLSTPKRPENTPVVGHLPIQALLHYTSTSPQQAAAVTGEFLQAAKRHFGQPLSDAGTPTWPPQLYHTVTTGNPPVFTATVLPAAGEKIVIGTLPGWQALANEELVIGRAPYDTRNLLPVRSEDITSSNILDHAQAVQYSLSGYSSGAEKAGSVVARFFKGLLVVVPEHCWPVAFKDTPVVVSAKDQKLCTLFQSLEDKKRLQANDKVERIALHGALEMKEVRTALIGVPPAMQESLSGDYDGDIIQIWPVAAFPETVELIREQNKQRLANPKMPKSFTRDVDGGLDMGKLIEIQSNMVVDSSVIANRYYSLPKMAQNALFEILADHHMLVQLFGDSPVGWQREAGLPDDFERLPKEEQHRLLVEREIGVLMKIGTDLEKTDFGVHFHHANERRKAYIQALVKVGKDFSLPQGEPFGKGLLRKLEASQQGDSAAKHTDVENILADALVKSASFGGLPNAILNIILGWLLSEKGAG